LLFACLVCEITHEIGAEFGVEFRFQALAMEALQGAAEAYLVTDFGSQHMSRNSWAHSAVSFFTNFILAALTNDR
jgi:hypothetical protein